METKEKCENAIKAGAYAALISMVITLIFSLIGFFYQSADQELNYFLDPWLLVDVALMAILAFFTYKKSRVAATLMLVYFISGKLIMWSDLGEVRGIPMTLLFLIFYARAAWASYVWHSKYAVEITEPEVASEI
jgi:hypothetical protein